MKTKQTTIRCSVSEKTLIEETAKKRGYPVRKFIGYCLDKHLPLSEKDFNKNADKIERTGDLERIGVLLPEGLIDKIDNEKDKFSTEFKDVRLFEIVLVVMFMECL